MIADWAVSLMDLIGAPGAGIAMVISPLPIEVVLAMAGLAASEGTFTLAEAIGWTTLGSVVSAYLFYGLGAWLGIDRLRRTVDRVPLMRGADVDRAVAWFGRHGEAAVFLGRMLPVVRTFVPVPAGVAGMSRWRFGLLTAAGSLIWNTAIISAGYLLGESWQLIETYAGLLQYGIYAAVAVGAASFLMVRWRQPNPAQARRAASSVSNSATAGPAIGAGRPSAPMRAGSHSARVTFARPARSRGGRTVSVRTPVTSDAWVYQA